MNLPQIHEQALRATGTVVEGVADRQLDLSSPCDGWSVRELLNHVVGGNYWAAELAAGKSIASNFAARLRIGTASDLRPSLPLPHAQPLARRARRSSGAWPS